MPTTDELRVRKRKNITLSDYGRDAVQAYADEQGVSFSRAIEALALMSLENEAALGQVQMMGELMVAKLMRPLDLFIQLVGKAVREAGAAKEAAAYSYFLQLLMLAESRKRADLAAQTLAEAVEAPASAEGDAVLEIYQRSRSEWQKRGVLAAKMPIEQWDAVLAAVLGEVEDSDKFE